MHRNKKWLRLKDPEHFSRIRLILIVLTFAAIGGTILLVSRAAPNPNLQGDLNNDNTVNGLDLSLLLGAWGTNNANYDLNGDGTINGLDMSILLAQWGQTYSGSGSVGGIPGVGTLDWGTNYSYQTNLDKYAVLGLSGGSESKASLYPNQTTIGYVSAAATESYWVGVNNTDAAANDWYLHCADGSLIHNSVYTNEMLLYPAYSTYQSAFVSQTLNFISKYGLKGVFIDEFNSDASARHPTCASGASASYPFYNKAGQVVIADPAAWQAAMLSWIKRVGPTLKSHGAYVEVNGAAGGTVTGWDDSGATTKTWMTSYAPYVSNAAVEYWMEGNTTYLRPTGTSAWWEHWDTWESLAEYVQTLGIDFSGIEHYPSGSCTNLQWQRYTRASFMLAWNGKGRSTWQTLGNKCNTWTTVTAYNPGLPTGARTQIAAGVWQRNFQNGTVVINTNTTSVTVPVNGKSITIPGTDAALM